MTRVATLQRKTSETDISLRIDLDGTGLTEINTGVPFFDHMIELMSKHGFFDLQIQAKGDVDVDFHHTVEDIGILMGEAFRKGLGDKKGIRRYGSAIIPMDEVLAQVALDICDRSHLIYHIPIEDGKVGNLDMEVIREFFQGFSYKSGTTLHINVFYGINRHHILEAIFKAFGRALREAAGLDPRIQGVLSTKGML